jgi:hypothetical protein
MLSSHCCLDQFHPKEEDSTLDWAANESEHLDPSGPLHVEDLQEYRIDAVQVLRHEVSSRVRTSRIVGQRMVVGQVGLLVERNRSHLVRWFGIGAIGRLAETPVASGESCFDQMVDGIHDGLELGMEAVADWA